MSCVLRNTSAITATILLQLLLPLIVFGGLTLKFKYVSSIYADEQGVPLKQPEGVACNDKSLLVVADTGNGRILRYTFKDGTLETVTEEIKVDQLSHPIKTEINSEGEIYVLDGKQRLISRISPSGEFKGYLNPSGLPSPTTYVPSSFSLDGNGNIYILDVFSERVLVLDSDGKYLRRLDFPKEGGFFSDIALDFKGSILLVDSVKARVFSAAEGSSSFSPLTESLKEYVRFPVSLTTDNMGLIYLVDRNGGSIIILGQDGSFLRRHSRMGWKDGRLNHPSQICLNGKGEMFVADTINSRVQIFISVE